MTTSNEDATTQSLPPVVRAAWLNLPADDAFRVFTDQIGAWWPLPTHGLFAEKCGGVAFRDGQLVEQSIDGAEVVWGEILVWEPPHRLVITWHPGSEPSMASQVEVIFESVDGGSRVVIEHRGWEIFGTDAANQRDGYVGPNAWGHVLDHFADGAELRHDAVDTSALAAAYDEFFSEAQAGRFQASPAGEWCAEQVVAHVALNDAAMLGVCHALIHARPIRFENHTCQEDLALERLILRYVSLEQLIAAGQEMANLVLAALVRLSPTQRSTLVQCKLHHDGQLVVDRELAWETVALETQTSNHLPAHSQQLRNLRYEGC